MKAIEPEVKMKLIQILSLSMVGWVGLLAAIPSAFAQTWTQTSAPSDLGWESVASSADGSKLVATGYDPPQIFTSTNSGFTWTSNSPPITGEPGTSWSSVASSADGCKLVGVAVDGEIYISTNSGLYRVLRSRYGNQWF